MHTYIHTYINTYIHAHIHTHMPLFEGEMIRDEQPSNSTEISRLTNESTRTPNMDHFLSPPTPQGRIPNLKSMFNHATNPTTGNSCCMNACMYPSTIYI